MQNVVVFQYSAIKALNCNMYICPCVFFLFFGFLGTLPSGVQLLICAHPKRRNSNCKNYSIVMHSEHGIEPCR
jgi:hypothetical protein